MELNRGRSMPKVRKTGPIAQNDSVRLRRREAASGRPPAQLPSARMVPHGEPRLEGRSAAPGKRSFRESRHAAQRGLRQTADPHIASDTRAKSENALQ